MGIFMQKSRIVVTIALLSSFLFVCIDLVGASEGRLLIYMDQAQGNHLKAYGVAYWCLTRGAKVQWLLNYRGGSFLCEDTAEIRNVASMRGVSFLPLDGRQVAGIYRVIEESNMEAVLLEKPPRIAIYTQPESEPWDDAVTLALEYAEIPYSTLWDREVLSGKLYEFDWIHLHHEDFTGQYGRFYASFRNHAWYRRQVRTFEKAAVEAGYPSVPSHKGAISREIKNFVKQGGFMFAMCAACDSMDIGLAAEGVDIVPAEIDGTPAEADCQEKLDFTKSLAFTDFSLEMNPLVYEFSDIDVDPSRYDEFINRGDIDLFEFSAKFDRTPTIFTQNHVNRVRGFLGQTTAFRRHTLKDAVIIMGTLVGEDAVKYLYGRYGKGTFTFYAGHDPEDFAHLVGDPPTNLALSKNSPGYRLILNNILFPAAKKKKQKT